MKLNTIIAALTALLIVSGCNNNSKSTDNMKDMSKLTFTEQQASAITVIACNEARGDQAPIISPSEWPLGNPNTAYAQYFIGNSYLAVLDNGLCNVTLNPATAMNGSNL